MSLGRESITSVVGGLLNFFNQGTVFFVFFFNSFEVLPFDLSWLLSYPYKISHGFSRGLKGYTVYYEARDVSVALVQMNQSATT